MMLLRRRRQQQRSIPGNMAGHAICIMIADSEYNSGIPEDVPLMTVQKVTGDVESVYPSRHLDLPNMPGILQRS